MLWPLETYPNLHWKTPSFQKNCNHPILGQYSYGYSNEDSYKNEQRTADGIVRGSYSYIDANGELQVVHYISDAFGFRVSATNLPEAPVAAVPVVQEPIGRSLHLD